MCALKSCKHTVENNEQDVQTLKRRSLYALRSHHRELLSQVAGCDILHFRA